MESAMETETAGVVTRTRLRGVAPIVPVRRVDRAVDFYVGVLGFRLADRNAEMTFAHVVRDGAGLLLLDLADAKALRATADYLSAYVWVEDVGALWAELRPRLERLGPNRVQPIFEKPDGRREFHVRDPDGCLLFFGEAIDR